MTPGALPPVVGPTWGQSPHLAQHRLRTRLVRLLRLAAAELRDYGLPARALELGAGHGPYAEVLLAAGWQVTVVDQSRDVVEVLHRDLGDSPGLTVHHDLEAGLAAAPGGVSLVLGTSVLHHVPDYLSMVEEMVRVLRPGGVAFIDHEVNEGFWDKEGCVAEFRRAVQAERASRPGWWNPNRKRWQYYLVPRNLIGEAQLRYRPQMIFCTEGDVHIWEFDHIEWVEVERGLNAAGAEVVRADEYLVYRQEYPHSIWMDFKTRCSDMRTVTARRSASAGATIDRP